MARLLGQGMVRGQRELDGAVPLPAPPDPGESAADAGQEKQGFGQDDDARHQQREREGGRQVELVAALLEGAGPAIGERVQCAQHQGHKAQRGLWSEKKAGVRGKGMTDAAILPTTPLLAWRRERRVALALVALG